MRQEASYLYPDMTQEKKLTHQTVSQNKWKWTVSMTKMLKKENNLNPGIIDHSNNGLFFDHGEYCASMCFYVV